MLRTDAFAPPPPARSLRWAAQGFSIIEVVITIAVMGILLAASLPSIGDWLRSVRVRNATEGIVNGLQQARGEAVRRNRPVSFSLVTGDAASPTELSNSCALSSSSASWVVSLNSPAGACGMAPSPGGTLVAKRAAGDGSSGVTVAAVRADGTTAATQVTFNGFGQVVNADAIGRIDLSATAGGGRSLRVLVGNGGAVRACDPAAATGDPRAC